MTDDLSDGERSIEGGVSQPVEQVWFDDQAGFDEDMAEFLRSTFQLDRKRSSASDSAKNNKVHEKVGWCESDLHPENLGPYYRKPQCTHAKDGRKIGKGEQTGHVVRSANCPAGIAATLAYDEHYRVKVTRAVYTYRHKLDRHIFDHYPSQ
ncbi:hypothetical protein Pcac1_g3806 [Phytophthora cactorum]|uniref:Uncharacterized protein n=1 Tax=Phytophthora cactorum TaxID=29920 RepID=A0A8T1ATN2_9STRA|nr:hypothetical protein Pcac1_g3806 [Phytophthora cactorum]KAG2886821.1 hypothetical protein PC115_g20559 [Phytophthora cactorum]KAG3133308.1 hypothetical protein C6341_g22584 [Phytophthora cactorum]